MSEALEKKRIAKPSAAPQLKTPSWVAANDGRPWGAFNATIAAGKETKQASHLCVMDNVFAVEGTMVKLGLIRRNTRGLAGAGLSFQACDNA